MIIDRWMRKALVMGSEIAIILGRVGRDAEVKYLAGSEAVCNFSVAVDQGKTQDGQERPPIWYNVSAWGNLAVVCGKFVKKGMMVQVQGRPRARAYTNNSGKAVASLDLLANSVQFASRAPEGGSRSDDGYTEWSEAQPPNEMDDIPF